MGNIVTADDIPDLIDGTVRMELRSESVVFKAEDDDWIEIPYPELGRLSQLVEYAIDKGLDEGMMDDAELPFDGDLE